jgi:tetratricopeptide (TPR) repeat protein
MSEKKNRGYRLFFAAGALFLVLSVVSVTLWLTLRRPPPNPPEPDLAEVDPEVAESIAAAQDKVRQQPSSGGAWGRLGMVLLAHDFHEEAQRSFAQAAHLDPADARWPYLRGLSLLLTEPNAGISCLLRAAELCGNEPLAPRLRLAETLLSQGQLDKAELSLEQARKIEPHNPRVQMGLGRLAALRGQWQKALEHLEPCTEDVHTRRLAHTLRAEAWTQLHETDKAREEQRQAAQAPEDQLWLDPYMEDVLNLRRGLSTRLQRAKDLLTHQRYQQAVQLLSETVQRYPQSAEARLLLGEVWRRSGRLEQAEQEFEDAVRIDSASVEGWFRLGCIQAARSQQAKAANSFRRAIRLKPDYADAHFNLGHRLKELGDASGAADAFRAALRCRPDHEPARQALREMERKTQ